MSDSFCRPDTYDQFIYDSVVESNEYEIKNLLEDDIIIDIGSHIGCFLYICAQKGAKNNLYGYEVDKSNFEQCKKNMKDKNIACQIHNQAVWRSDIDDQHKLFFSGYGYNNGTGNVLWPEHNDNEISWISLDDILLKFNKIRLLKMDIEGAEYPVLFTCKQLHKVEEIIGEFHALQKEYPDFAIVNGYNNTIDDLVRYLEYNLFDVQIQWNSDGLTGFFKARKKSINKIYPITGVIIASESASWIRRPISDLICFCDEVIVIDSFSKDNTIEICSEYSNVFVYQRYFDTFHKQYNFALTKAKNDWVFMLDTDESLCDELICEFIPYFFKNKLNEKYTSVGFKLINYIDNKRCKDDYYKYRLFKSNLRYPENKYLHSQIDWSNAFYADWKYYISHKKTKNRQINSNRLYYFIDHNLYENFPEGVDEGSLTYSGDMDSLNISKDYYSIEHDKEYTHVVDAVFNKLNNLTYEDEFSIFKIYERYHINLINILKYLKNNKVQILNIANDFGEHFLSIEFNYLNDGILVNVKVQDDCEDNFVFRPDITNLLIDYIPQIENGRICKLNLKIYDNILTAYEKEYIIDKVLLKNDQIAMDE